MCKVVDPAVLRVEDVVLLRIRHRRFHAGFIAAELEHFAGYLFGCHIGHKLRGCFISPGGGQAEEIICQGSVFGDSSPLTVAPAHPSGCGSISTLGCFLIQRDGVRLVHFFAVFTLRIAYTQLTDFNRAQTYDFI